MNNSILGMNILADQSLDMDYNISSLPIYIQKENLSDFPQGRTASHWNNGLEIIRILSGAMNIAINGVKHPVAENDICIINSGCVHYFDSIDGSDCSYNCYIVEESVFPQNDDVIKQYLNPLFRSFHPSVSIVGSESDCLADLTSILDQISSYAIRKSPAYEIYIAGLFNIFIALLYETHPLSFNANANHNSKLNASMRKMLSYIHINYAHSISSEDLCKAGEVSRSQCFTLFKKYTGDTPANFILKYRLYIARNLLSSTDLSIAQIATGCGFAHQSHLTSHFAKYYGITPLHYRKKRSSR